MSVNEKSKSLRSLVVSVSKVNGISDPIAQPDSMLDDFPNWVFDPWYPMISSREGHEDLSDPCTCVGDRV